MERGSAIDGGQQNKTQQRKPQSKWAIIFEARKLPSKRITSQTGRSTNAIEEQKETGAVKKTINKIKEKIQRWIDKIPRLRALKIIDEAHEKGLLEIKEEPAPRGQYHYKEINGEKYCLGACFFMVPTANIDLVIFGVTV